MNIVWYIARAGGLVAWALLAGSVGWGLVLSSRLWRSKPRPAWTLEIHRFLGALAVVFTAIHIAALVADSYVHFGPAEILLPLASSWHPVAVTWGVVAMYLLIAVEVSSLLRRRLSNAAWKRIHRTSFALFVFASFHGVTAGTDMTSRAAGFVALGLTGLLAFFWLARVLTAGVSRARQSGHAAKAEPAA